MRCDLAHLRSYEERGLLKSARHPELPLSIWNYTPKVTYDRLWDEVTTMCRGLIVDDSGLIVGRPFPKFYNLDEHEALVGPVPDEPFEVTEKLDGSLIIMARYQDGHRLVVASRGSFISDQAARARKLLPKYLYCSGWSPDTPVGLLGATLCLEIIYPENRIVVDYGDREELVLLAAFATQTGDELELDQRWGFPIARREFVDDFRHLPARENSEGYVVRFVKSGVRVKLKTEEYIRLHRLLTGTTARRIWEAMRDKQIEHFVEHVPEEFEKWVRDTAWRIRGQYDELLRQGLMIVKDLERTRPRKELADEILRRGQPLAGIAFMLLDDKDPDALLWRLVKPAAGDTPFRSPADDV